MLCVSIEMDAHCFKLLFTPGLPPIAADQSNILRTSHKIKSILAFDGQTSQTGCILLLVGIAVPCARHHGLWPK